MNRIEHLCLCLCVLAVAASEGVAQTPAEVDRRCAPDSLSKVADGVTVVFAHGWSDHNGGSVVPLARVHNGEIYPVDGSVVLAVETLVNVSNGSRHVLSERRGTYIEDTGACRWTAHTPTTEPSDPVIFATENLSITTDPTEAARSEFSALRTTCTSPAPDGAPPYRRRICDRSRLVATSDLDSDSQREYWYRMPDRYGTAWVIAEATEEPGELRILVKYCGYFVCEPLAF